MNKNKKTNIILEVIFFIVLIFSLGNFFNGIIRDKKGTVIHGTDISTTEVISTETDTYTLYKSLKYTYKDLGEYNTYISHYAPSTGNLNILVIPIWFSNSLDFFDTDSLLKGKTVNDVYTDLERAYFGTEETNWKSVKQFYEEESLGKLTITGIITEPYKITDPSSYYLTDDGLATKTCYLAENVLEFYANKYDYKEFDSDKNGFIDVVSFIYFAPNYSRYSGQVEGNNLWAYTTWEQRPRNIKGANLNGFLWASYDFMYRYTYPEKDDMEIPELNPETYIHETGHLFGLHDLYDYTPMDQNGRSPAGKYSMQDQGFGVHDAYSRIALGWFNNLYVTRDLNFRIQLNNTGDFILIPNTARKKFSGSPFSEYLLIEFYNPKWIAEGNLNFFGKLILKDLPDKEGYRIWHIDSRLLQIIKKDNDFEYNKKSITSNIMKSEKYDLRYLHIASNSTRSKASIGHCSPDEEFDKFCLVKLIHKEASKAIDFIPDATFSGKSLFTEGSVFIMSNYRQYFFYDAFDNKSSFNLAILFEADNYISLNKINGLADKDYL